MDAHILVVNDTQEILDAFRELLEDAGYRVTTSGVAIKDVRVVERLTPDLVILDLVMGGERLGWQTLELMKLNRATAAIPVIICTAAVREIRDIEPDLLAKSVRLLAKPFDIDELLEMVRQALIARRTDVYERAHGDESGGGNSNEGSSRPEGGIKAPQPPER